MAPLATAVRAHEPVSWPAGVMLCVVAALSSLCHCDSSNAEESFSAASVEAVYLYRFSGYVEWPPEALSYPRFTIAVLGDDEVAEALSRVLTDRSVGGLPATVRRARNVRDLGDTQLVYIGEGYRGDLRALISSLGHRPVLVVTDELNGLGAGSMVNFVITEGKVRFEVSLASATRAGLKISSQLLAVAVRVQTGQLLRPPTSCRSVDTGVGCVQVASAR